MGEQVLKGSAMVTVIMADGAAEPVLQAGHMLAEEVKLRAGVDVRQASHFPPGAAGLSIVVGVRDEVERLVPALRLAEPACRRGSPAPEGYVVQRVGPGSPSTVVAGNDVLGALFGVGRLLRESRLTRRKVELPTGPPIPSAPDMQVRGIQLGYREVNNTLDAWDLPQFDRYLRDLIMFGCNAVELTPPVQPPSDRAQPGDLVRREWEMNLRLSTLVHSYGLKVSLWVPVTDGDPRTPNGRGQILDNRRRLFESMPHVDDVLVPGGDPGDTPVDVLLPLMAEIAAVLHAVHSAAGVWVSHQGFEPPERDRFYQLLSEERPAWLRGVVFGPWTRDSIEHTREAVPAEYAVRAYPDITHSCRCQYPVPDWDQAYALVEGREVANPRPEQHRAIFRHIAPHCDGFVAYSDGNHDDANKMLWLALGWDPTIRPEECMAQYGRVFVSPEAADEVGRGLFGLERNWLGPARRNAAIRETLAIWQHLHAAHPTNWRVQLHHFRGLCDRYVQVKARHDDGRERRVRRLLQQALREEVALDVAIDDACRALGAPMPSRLRELREELWALGRALRESIGLQMSVELGGLDERGNVLDHLDEPLNNGRWMLALLGEAAGRSDAEQLAAMGRVLDWEDPGPGGHYDDLGNPGRQPHLLVQSRWHDDLDCVRRPFADFSFREHAASGRLAWRCQATALYDAPLKLRYADLNPSAQYTLRVVYAGRFRTTITLTANGRIPIHGPQPTPDRPEVLEFEIPRTATTEGVLELEWRRVGHEGRGPQVAEAWLVRG